MQQSALRGLGEGLGLDYSFIRRLKTQEPPSSTPDQLAEDKKKKLFLYGAYAVGAVAVLGLGYVAFGSKRSAVANSGSKFYLNRVWLNRGGYDSSGRYWGIGIPLFEYQTADTSEYGYLRAASRAQAKAKIKTMFPGAKFFR